MGWPPINPARPVHVYVGRGLALALAFGYFILVVRLFFFSLEGALWGLDLEQKMPIEMERRKRSQFERLASTPDCN
jgi:hypothetical protein